MTANNCPKCGRPRLPEQDPGCLNSTCPWAPKVARKKPTEAVAVPIEKFADCGPGKWWFVHHPDGFLIEAAIEQRAQQLATEINAGRAALQAGAQDDR